MDEKIIFATQNQHKVKEIQNILGTQFRLLSLKDVGVETELPEHQPILEGNALQKARFIYEQFHLPCFADDTGLEVFALEGAPGVFSARYAGTLDLFGSEEKRTEANIQKLLLHLNGQADRRARFRTVIAYIKDNQDYIFEGIVEGTITEHKRGYDGFGYDPVFLPDGFHETFAEMSLPEKNQISHRARAFRKLVDFLTNTQ